MALTTRRCSVASFRDSSSCSGRRLPPSPMNRSAVPARGRLWIRFPVRSTRSSGLAPTNCPFGVGTEKMVQFGSSSCQRRSRVGTSTGAPRTTSIWRASTTLTSWPASMVASASSTMATKDVSVERGSMLGSCRSPADRPATGQAGGR